MKPLTLIRAGALFGAGLALALAIAPRSALAQSPFTWDGGDGSSPLWSTPGNWNPDSAPANLFNADFFFGGTLNTGTAGTPLNNDLTTGTITNLTWSAGAGSFYLGGNTFTNRGHITNASGMAQYLSAGMVVGANTPGTTNAHFINVGSGSVTMSGPVAAPAGNSTLMKLGTGTLYLTSPLTNILGNGTPGGGTGWWLPGFGADEGTVIFDGGPTSLYNVNGEAAFGRTAPTGNKNVTVIMQSGKLASTTWMGIGRGNGTGDVLAELILNGSSVFNPVNWSGCYNGNDGSKRPRGTVTQNNTSLFWVNNNNNNNNWAESAGSYLTHTVNDAAILQVGSGVDGSVARARVGIAGRSVIKQTSPTATVTFGQAHFGDAAGGAGAFYNRGIYNHRSPASTDHFSIGSASGGATPANNSYGYYLHDTATPVGLREIGVGGAGSGDGVLEVRQGSLYVSNWVTMCRGQSTTVGAQQSSLLMIRNGTVFGPNLAQCYMLQSGSGISQYSVLDVGAGGKLGSLGPVHAMNLANANNALSYGIVTLSGGGMIEINRIYCNQVNPQTVINFNNGTLKAMADSAAFIGANVDGVYVHAGGVTFDTAGFNVATVPSLQAPTDSGILSIPVATPGAGYIGRPLVRITDATGMGATAIAEWSEASGTITGITITCPGSAYTAPTVSLVGGGFTNAATLGTPVLGPVTSGGLTKTGAGTLTLSGGSTYTGPTTITGGTLSVVASSITPSTAAPLTISNGALTVDLSGGFSWLPAGNVTLQNNAVLNFNYGTLYGNPFYPAIDVAGNLSTPGASIVINVTGFGLQVTGTAFPLIRYTGSGPADIANISIGTLPPGVEASLINNTANKTIDLNVTRTGQNLAWYGLLPDGLTMSSNWDITLTTNWVGVGTVSPALRYQEYTSAGSTVGDPVRFDDYLYNDYLNPPPTNIFLASQLRPFTVTVDSTMPYAFFGPGRLSGQGSLIKTNTGTLTIGTSNDYTGGTFLYGGTLVVSNNAGLGAPAGGLTLGGGGLEVTANTATTRPITVNADTPLIVDPGVTAQIGSVLSGASRLLVRGGGTATVTNATRLQFHVNQGSLILEGNAKATNYTSYASVGVGTGESGRMTVRGNATFDCNQDLNFGDVNDATGRLDIQDNAIVRSANLMVAKWNSTTGYVYQAGGLITNHPAGGADWRVGGWDAAAASSSGFYNLSGGKLDCTKNFQIGAYGYGEMNITGGAWNQWVGYPVIGRYTNGIGVMTINGGQFNQFSTAAFFIIGEQGTGTLNIGGTGVVNLTNAIRIAHAGNGIGTVNLNTGGRLITPAVMTTGPGISSTFNFNGGTLQPNANTSAFMQGLTTANILGGGAVIDTAGKDITIAQALLDGTGTGSDGGLTKSGVGTLQLSGTCSYFGPTTVSAGRLYIYPGSFLGSGAITVADNATFGAVVTTPGVATVNGLTLGNSGASSLDFTLGTNGNPTAAVLKVGTLTVNGTCSVHLAGKFTVGTFPLVRYGALAGSGAFNPVVTGPQGLVASISNHVAGNTYYVVVSSLGPGIVWTGTNSGAGLANLWDLNTTTNWTVSGVPTYYAELSPPGDSVRFDDTGSGAVLLNTGASPNSILVTNASKNYTFQGLGYLTGPSGLTKQGAATLVMSLTNNDYAGDTLLQGGTLQIGSGTAIPDGLGKGSVTISSGATLELNDNSETINGLGGVGTVNNAGSTAVMLTVGNGDASTTWNGTINNTGAGGLALAKVGSGTMTVGGTNYLNNGTASQVNGGTLILGNNSYLTMSSAEFWVAQNATTGAVVVAGGTLEAANNWIAIGRNNAAAVGTLTVNSGKVIKAGGNNIVLGSLGATGTLIVNGGQVLNNGMLWLGENATAKGYLYLNGGLVQATQVRSNGVAPVESIAYLNGGTLQASGNQADYFQCAALVGSKGFTFDDGGYTVTLATAPLMEDPTSTGGGMTKTGTGRLNLNTVNTYTGLTRVTGGTLGGSGTIGGPVTVEAGGNLEPGVAGTTVGTLLIVSQPLTLQGNATFRIRKVSGLPENDSVAGISTANYGGTLTVSNITAEPLVVGDQFPLFSAASGSGNFAAIVGSPGPGLAYEFVPASGVLKVITGIATNPTNITYTVGGGNLTISWPADHLGWILQGQTNSLTVGISNNWVDMPATASATQVVIPMDSTQPTVFFRLRKP